MIVGGLTVEYRKIEIRLSAPRTVDEFEGIDLRHDKA